jgi:hypothetical protein
LDMVTYLATARGGILDLLPFFALLGFAIAGLVLVIVTLVLMVHRRSRQVAIVTALVRVGSTQSVDILLSDASKDKAIGLTSVFATAPCRGLPQLLPENSWVRASLSR